MRLTVTNSPFTHEQAELANALIANLTDAQRFWLSGYLAAVPSDAGQGAAGPAAAAVQAPARKEVTILYGTQTGNAKGLAKKTGKTLEEHGFQVTVSSMSDFKFNQLKKIQYLLIIVSTHGEGDPPDQAVLFHEFLHSRRAPKLDGMKYSVLALGDSSYEHFCQTGKEIDAKLKELGAAPLYPRVDCDLDYDEPAAEWMQGVLESLRQAEGAAGESKAAFQAAAAWQTAVEPAYSRTNPFHAEVLENLNLNGRGSIKETRHLELLLEGSGLVFEPGDSIGIIPKNDPALVDLLLQELEWDPDASVTVNKQGDIYSFKEALTSYFEITVLTKPLLEKAAELSTNAELKELLAPGSEERLKAYIEGRDLIDFVRDFGLWAGTPQEFVSILRKIPSRQYSVASSLKAHPDTVHLLVGVVRYEAHGRKRKGVCSSYLAERIQPGDQLSIYVQPNENFRLPENPDTPIIMIGPGTGVAPFRAFLQEREELGAQGKTWLFFGNPHFMTDFLYQTEWLQWHKEGVLTKLDVAFSRDTDEKVYVQHRMLERSREFYAWLQEGAAVYVCGDEKRMARDVHNTLLAILEREGAMSREKAEEYLSEMQRQKRYQRDVY